jgi:Protein of unknown function (DUF3455)
MLKAITLVICSYTIFLAVFALPPPAVKANVALFSLPPTITPPGKTTLEYVYQGFGTQNYTCNATSGTFLTSGTATAELLDVTPFFCGSTAPPVLPAIQDLQAVGQHFFVSVGNATDPRFQNERDFFVGVKNASVPSSQPTYSVASVLLTSIGGNNCGSLADFVVRTDVVGGVVPTVLNTCQAGDVIAIPYKAHYLFFKNS